MVTVDLQILHHFLKGTCKQSLMDTKGQLYIADIFES